MPHPFIHSFILKANCGEKKNILTLATDCLLNSQADKAILTKKRQGGVNPAEKRLFFGGGVFPLKSLWVEREQGFPRDLLSETAGKAASFFLSLLQAGLPLSPLQALPSCALVVCLAVFGSSWFKKAAQVR